MKLFLLKAVVWAQVNAPVVLPLLDRLLHLFGGCGGH